MKARQERLTSLGDRVHEELLGLISAQAAALTERWREQVKRSPSTQHYRTFEDDELYRRAHFVYSHLGRWLRGGVASEQEMQTHYRELGTTRLAEGFKPSQVVAALLITQRVLRDFLWKEGIQAVSEELYTKTQAEGRFVEVVQAVVLKLSFRIQHFFYQAILYTLQGFEK